MIPSLYTVPHAPLLKQIPPMLPMISYIVTNIPPSLPQTAPMPPFLTQITPHVPLTAPHGTPFSYRMPPMGPPFSYRDPSLDVHTMMHIQKPAYLFCPTHRLLPIDTLSHTETPDQMYCVYQTSDIKWRILSIFTTECTAPIATEGIG